jgi:hypothetical protein
MKPKGQGVTDRFYSKAQSLVVNACVNGAKPVITDWSETTYFVTVDRVAFFIIPKDKFCLMEKFYIPCNKLFLTENTYLCEIYGREFSEAHPTGNQTRDNFTGQTVIEFETPYGLRYLDAEKLQAFPKQRLYCVAKPDGPIFILTTLRVLLGGVWHLKTKKAESGYSNKDN